LVGQLCESLMREGTFRYEEEGSVMQNLKRGLGGKKKKDEWGGEQT